MSKQAIKKNCKYHIFDTIIDGKPIYNVALSFKHSLRGKTIGRVPAATLNMTMVINSKKKKINLGIERDKFVLDISKIVHHIYKDSLIVLYTDSETDKYILVFFTPELRKPEYDYAKQLDNLFERFNDNLSMVELISYNYK